MNEMGRPKKKEPTDQVRVPESVAKLIRHIALHRGQDPGDYIAERFAALLEEDRQQMLKEMEQQRKKGRT